MVSGHGFFSISIGFLLSYILLNLYNFERPIKITEEDNDNGCPRKGPLSCYRAIIGYTEKWTTWEKVGITSIVLILAIVWTVAGNKMLSLLVIMVLTFFAIIIFMLSTYSYNYSLLVDEGEDAPTKGDILKCKSTQMNLFRRKYSHDENITSKGYSWLNYIDSTLLYRIIYFLGLCYLLYSTGGIEQCFYIAGYFLFGIVIQLIPSFLLRSYSDYTSWPSFFDYIDQYIQNNNDPRRWFFTVIGLIRIIVLLIISIYLTSRLIKSYKLSSLYSVLVFWAIFIGYLTFWQLFIGDGCIIERTLDDYSKKKKRSLTTILANNFKSFADNEGKQFIDALVCAIDNQFGIYFYILIISLCLAFLGFKTK